MAISKVERLMNLVICLLSTRQFLTAEKIRESVAGYSDSASHEAFSRMFERDKNELRDLGIPLETGQAKGSSAEGYRINRTAYELPEVDLDATEAAAVAVAARLWGSPEMVSASQTALLKLRAAGVQVDSDFEAVPVSTVPARTRGSEDSMRKLLEAIDAGRAVTFRHRSAPTEEFATRTVQPWGVVTLRGRWYLVGHDVDRDATRTFRLSRIADPVQAIGPENAVRKPPGIDLRAIVDKVTGAGSVTGRAVVWVTAGRALELRRLGTMRESREFGGRPGETLEIPVRSWEWIARLIAGHGDDAVVLEPESLRSSVQDKLRFAAGVDVDGGEVVR
ncbi:helix-turn-helix transcriptional regulator [Rhodococcus xishaensis]|uniref:YafY family transcriptional regulator n=1 Tax=Rhodococcus xishaensis TaxID=2487364 RepID=A0A3S3BLT2_9NOCA|nr:YafY family protein [Rhodococcus xishaensis]RVW04356.1 YafY family transcriptional regulator [Rhodococcus xishaensis]